MIEAKDVFFSYGSKEVLKGISFSFENNKILSILGPNGTGKTTFLRCVCGQSRPSSGTISVDGTDISRLRGRELARKIGYVPQSAPASRISVFDSILMGRRPYIDWMASEEDIDKVSAVIEGLGMESLSLKYLTEISGGELQKTQIARAIVQEPSVLVLDEPTNNLDIANQHRTMEIITDIVRSKDMCTIMTMHDINLATHYSDSFLFLKDGRIAAYGGCEVITEDLIKEVYGMDVEIVEHRGLPVVVPRSSPMYRS